MKYDLNHLNRGKRRTLQLLSKALFDALMKKDFDNISVTELCDSCLIPKATFYNYFEDKYDLLQYCFDAARYYVLGTFEENHTYDGEAATQKMLRGIEQYRSQLSRVIRANPVGSTLYWRLANYLSIMYERILTKNPHFVNTALPREFQCRINAQNLTAVLYWCIPAGLSAEEISLFIRETNVS